MATLPHLSRLASQTGGLFLAFAALFRSRLRLGRRSRRRGIAPVAPRATSASRASRSIPRATPRRRPRERLSEAARLAGQDRRAQLSDSQLSAMVSSIVIEASSSAHGATSRAWRVFDRARASGYLGGEGEVALSAPCADPVTFAAGPKRCSRGATVAARVGRIPDGASRIDYVPHTAQAAIRCSSPMASGRRSRCGGQCARPVRAPPTC